MAKITDEPDTPYQAMWKRVMLGDRTALQEPEIATLMDTSNTTPLHLAAMVWEETLRHPLVAKVKNSSGVTPLHYAAKHWVSALQHPEVATVCSISDRTPLDWAAEVYPEAFDHPAAQVMLEDGDYLIHRASRMQHSTVYRHKDFQTLKNEWGDTPEDVWGVDSMDDEDGEDDDIQDN